MTHPIEGRHFIYLFIYFFSAAIHSSYVPVGLRRKILSQLTMSVLLSSTNRPQGGSSDGCAACGGKHVKHTCGKAKPPTCKRRRAQERELEFENPGRQNLRGFCEGCEDKRRKLSAQAKAAEEMKRKTSGSGGCFARGVRNAPRSLLRGLT